MQKTHLVFLLGLLICLQTQVILAKSTRIDQARAWVEQGEKALQKGQLRDALLAFESAERHQSSLNHKMLIAKVYEAMPKNEGCLRAIHTWGTVLKELKTQKSSLINRAEKKILALKTACKRKVSVITKPSGAKIWIDDELLGFSPLLIEVNAEAKKLKAQYHSEEKQISLEQETSEYRFDFSEVTVQNNPQVNAQVIDESVQQFKVQQVAHNSNEPIQFKAQLQCRALIEGQYEQLSSCQSRALWEGDQFKLSFESDQPVYLYVFLSNHTGQRQTLFPRGQVSNLLPARTPSELPMKNWFTLDHIGPVTETIYVVYARKPVQAFESLRSLNVPADQKQPQIKTLAMASRGVVLPANDEGLTLTVAHNLEEQSQFVGRDEVNRVEFELFHQGARPKAE